MFAKHIEDIPAPLQQGYRARTSATLLALGAIICSLGLGSLALTFSAPREYQISTLPPLAPTVAPGIAEPKIIMRNWPDIFGSPVEPDPVATAAATILPPPPPEPLNVKLRGLAIDDDGGWALLQMDGEIIRVRVGNAVGPNHVVKEIRSSGVLITGDGEVETLVFDD